MKTDQSRIVSVCGDHIPPPKSSDMDCMQIYVNNLLNASKELAGSIDASLNSSSQNRCFVIGDICFQRPGYFDDNQKAKGGRSGRLCFIRKNVIPSTLRMSVFIVGMFLTQHRKMVEYLLCFVTEEHCHTYPQNSCKYVDQGHFTFCN